MLNEITMMIRLLAAALTCPAPVLGAIVPWVREDRGFMDVPYQAYGRVLF
jgi:hypothetical protein